MNLETRSHYGLRKLSIGLASVLLGITFLGGVQTVKADTVDQNVVTAQEKTQNNTTDTNSNKTEATTLDLAKKTITEGNEATKEDTAQTNTQNKNLQNSEPVNQDTPSLVDAPKSENIAPTTDSKVDNTVSSNNDSKVLNVNSKLTPVAKKSSSLVLNSTKLLSNKTGNERTANTDANDYGLSLKGTINNTEVDLSDNDYLSNFDINTNNGKLNVSFDYNAKDGAKIEDFYARMANPKMIINGHNANNVGSYSKDLISIDDISYLIKCKNYTIGTFEPWFNSSRFHLTSNQDTLNWLKNQQNISFRITVPISQVYFFRLYSKDQNHDKLPFDVVSNLTINDKTIGNFDMHGQTYYSAPEVKTLYMPSAQPGKRENKRNIQYTQHTDIYGDGLLNIYSTAEEGTGTVISSVIGLSADDLKNGVEFTFTEPTDDFKKDFGDLTPAELDKRAKDLQNDIAPGTRLKYINNQGDFNLYQTPSFTVSRNAFPKQATFVADGEEYSTHLNLEDIINAPKSIDPSNVIVSCTSDYKTYIKYKIQIPKIESFYINKSYNSTNADVSYNDTDPIIWQPLRSTRSEDIAPSIFYDLKYFDSAKIMKAIGNKQHLHIDNGDFTNYLTPAGKQYFATHTFTVNGVTQLPALDIDNKGVLIININAKGKQGSGNLVVEDQTGNKLKSWTFSGIVGDNTKDGTINADEVTNWINNNHYILNDGQIIPTVIPITDVIMPDIVVKVHSKTIQETKDVTRIIIVVDPITRKQTRTIQTVTFTRTNNQNADGSIRIGQWNGGSNDGYWNEFDAPEIKGYKPSLAKIDKEKITPATKETISTIIYTKVNSGNTNPGDNTPDDNSFKEVQETKDITRKIIVVDPITGKNNITIQKVTFTRTNAKNINDGTIKYGDWNQSSGIWTEFDVPTIPGYKATQTKVDRKEVTPTTENKIIIIKYDLIKSDNTNSNNNNSKPSNESPDNADTSQNDTGKLIPTNNPEEQAIPSSNEKPIIPDQSPVNHESYESKQTKNTNQTQIKSRKPTHSSNKIRTLSKPTTSKTNLTAAPQGDIIAKPVKANKPKSGFTQIKQNVNTLPKTGENVLSSHMLLLGLIMFGLSTTIFTYDSKRKSNK